MGRRISAIRARRLAIDPTCAYCGRRLDDADSTLDHVVPQSAGGTSHNWNLRLACATCNVAKGCRKESKLVCLLPRGTGIGILRNPRELEKRVMAKVSFNYKALKNVEVRNRVKQSAADIRELLQRDAACIVELGQRLIEVRELLGSGADGKFRTWIDAEFELAPSSCYTYIRVAERFGDLDCLQQFQPFALYKLARSAVPQSAVDAAIARARAGEFITGKKAKAILADHGHVTKRYETKRSRRVELPAGAFDADPAGSPSRDSRQSPLEVLTRSLDAFADNLEAAAGEISRQEREALADRFLTLALALRSIPAASSNGRSREPELVGAA